jgi:uncharacterized membrane protein
MHFDRLVVSAFEQIRLYARTDIAVSLRLLRAFNNIAVSTSDPKFRRILVEYGARTLANCAENFDEENLKELRARQAALESLNAILEPAN